MNDPNIFSLQTVYHCLFLNLIQTWRNLVLWKLFRKLKQIRWRIHLSTKNHLESVLSIILTKRAKLLNSQLASEISHIVWKQAKCQWHRHLIKVIKFLKAHNNASWSSSVNYSRNLCFWARRWMSIYHPNNVSCGDFCIVVLLKRRVLEVNKDFSV